MTSSLQAKGQTRFPVEPGKTALKVGKVRIRLWVVQAPTPLLVEMVMTPLTTVRIRLVKALLLIWSREARRMAWAAPTLLAGLKQLLVVVGTTKLLVLTAQTLLNPALGVTLSLPEMAMTPSCRVMVTIQLLPAWGPTPSLPEPVRTTWMVAQATIA